jgi:N-acetylglutamate synthase-like GNAT family acetyltransferase
METITLRRAMPHDAASICTVLIRSVREICARDYAHDEALLRTWCANKTVENVTQWIGSPANYCIVAEHAGHGLVGVGLLHEPAGEIMLCYILPEVLHGGVGKRILATLEQQAQRCGHVRVRLVSTITARDFYRRNGYIPDGVPTAPHGITGFPMLKRLGELSSAE